MTIASWAAAFVAAGFHVLAFVMESLLWMTPAVQRRFRQTPEQAQVTRLLAFNQGYYNLFLAGEILAGFALVLSGRTTLGTGLAAWACLSMVGAAAVLLWSSPKMLRGALFQGVPPLLFLVLVFVQRLG